jgi:hypothetical protein
VQVAGSSKAASDALAARVRSAARSASTGSSGVIVSQTAGMMNGTIPSGTPRPPSSTTVFGADPSRYGAP